MKKLSPSLLSADFSILRQEIAKVEQAGAQYLHLDIMDGHFVPNITFGAPVVKALRPFSSMVFDVHLMICEPEKYLDDFILAGADIVNIHLEAEGEKLALLRKIKQKGMKSAVTLKPQTSAMEAEPLLKEVDMVLVMSVEPGFGGQKFMPEMLEKVKTLCRLRKEKGLSFEIEIDGGITLSNAREAFSAGADVLVAGSAVFGAPNTVEAVQEFLRIGGEFL